MKKRMIACILALTVAFSMTACGDDKKDDTKETSNEEQQDENESEEADVEADTKGESANRGTVEENVYTNEAMGIQLTLPEGCTLYSDEEIAQIVGNGADIMEDAGADSDALENSLSGTVYDVVAVTADQTANIQIIMEDTENSVGRELTAEEYSQAMVNSLKAAYTSAGVEMGEAEITEETLGGMEFSKVSVSVNGMTQEYHSHQVGKYMMVFAVTYTEIARETVQQLLDSVTAL